MSDVFDEGRRMTDPASANLREKKKAQKGKKGAPPKNKVDFRRKTFVKYGQLVKPSESKLKSTTKQYTFLYRYRVTLRYFCDRYGLSPRTMEFLIAASAFEHFVVDELCEIVFMPESFKKKEFLKLRDNNYLAVYQYKPGKTMERSNVYTISKHGVEIVTDFYALLLGEKKFPKFAWGDSE
jgi:hypothetical protein